VFSRSDSFPLYPPIDTTLSLAAVGAVLAGPKAKVIEPIVRKMPENLIGFVLRLCVWLAKAEPFTIEQLKQMYVSRTSPPERPIDIDTGEPMLNADGEPVKVRDKRRDNAAEMLKRLVGSQWVERLPDGLHVMTGSSDKGLHQFPNEWSLVEPPMADGTAMVQSDARPSLISWQAVLKDHLFQAAGEANYPHVAEVGWQMILKEYGGTEPELLAWLAANKFCLRKRDRAIVSNLAEDD